MSGKTMSTNDHKISRTGRTLQICSFRLADRLFGVNILDVKEVNSEIEITPIYHAQSSVRGYMNIRGQIHLVIDLRTEFGFPRGVITPESKVIIFKQSVDEPFGVLVDSIGDVVEVTETEITDRRGQTNESDTAVEVRRARSELCEGVCPLKQELMLLLNARGILQYKRTNAE